MSKTIAMHVRYKSDFAQFLAALCKTAMWNDHASFAYFVLEVTLTLNI